MWALEDLDAIKTATRAKVLAAFTAGQGYTADADYGPRVLADSADPDHPGWVTGPAQRYPVAESRAREKGLSSSLGSCSGANQATSVSSSSLTAGEPSMIAASYTAVT